MKKQKMTPSKGRREVIGWKKGFEPQGWYPEIGLFDKQSQREAARRAREAEEAKKNLAEQLHVEQQRAKKQPTKGKTK